MTRKPSLEQMPLLKNGNGWKNTPVTIGILIAFIAGAAICASWAWRSGDQARALIKKTVEETMHHHSKEDVDSAHPTLPKRYLSKGEFHQVVNRIDRNMGEIRQTQQIILERLPRRRRVDR